jgi:ketosteroid isomerase-like protein
MSQENVEIARRSLEAYHRGDVDAAVEDFAPDFELDMSRAIGMDRGVYSLNQFRRLAEEFWEVWETVQVGVGADEFVEAGEHAVMPFANRLRGRDGIEVQARGTWLCTIRDGLIVRICLYQEVREALEAAGLSE